MVESREGQYMTELERILDETAEEQSKLRIYDRKAVLLAVLRRRLLPLLEAGQVLSNTMVGYVLPPDVEHLMTAQRKAGESYRAAKQKALEP